MHYKAGAGSTLRAGAHLGTISGFALGKEDSTSSYDVGSPAHTIAKARALSVHQCPSANLSIDLPQPRLRLLRMCALRMVWPQVFDGLRRPPSGAGLGVLSSAPPPLPMSSTCAWTGMCL